MKDYSFLLNRPEADFLEYETDRYFKSRRVLVTGAGGTIGSEICRRLAGKAAFLGGLGHSELPIFNLKPELADCGRLRLADITQPLDDVFRDWKPDVVIHAAAHKHVGLLESQPGIAYRNNFKGTVNVAETARRFGVEKFVFISTDKAAQPTSVMGKSKRLAELWLLAYYKSAGIVRFGNVLGSSGSLVEIIEKNIETGKPIMLTHPEMQRYFITVREAAMLALMAAISDPGIFTLDMGEPVKITEIVNKLLLAHPGSRSEIFFGNPGSGEKLTETLLNIGEELERTIPTKVCRIKSPEIVTEDVWKAVNCFFDEYHNM
jgi:FlaA1/EpsC-like NDP-sugar epimerase